MTEDQIREGIRQLRQSIKTDRRINLTAAITIALAAITIGAAILLG